jgi:hypothetical protein
LISFSLGKIKRAFLLPVRGCGVTLSFITLNPRQPFALPAHRCSSVPKTYFFGTLFLL